MEVNKSIAKVRKTYGYSQSQIAELLQTTQQQYSKYETGLQEIPVRHIIKLSEIYRISIEQLIGTKIYMTVEEGSMKFQKLYDETINIINWAYDQRHIDEDQLKILSDNVQQAKIDIEKE